MKTEFTTIPKLLSPRRQMEYVQKIPRIIWQTLNTNNVPMYLKSYTDTWINLNPEYEYRFHDDNDIINFLICNFPNYLEGYKKLKYGASKADLWRYLIIYKYGGVYADLDCKCVTPLREWLNPEAAFTTQLGINKDICQWLIISVANNPIFLKAAEMTLKNSETNNSYTTHYGFEYFKEKLFIRENMAPLRFDHAILGLSGPPVLQNAAEVCFRDGSISDILPYSQIVCVSGPKISCQMAGNVTHNVQNRKFKKAYEQLKLKHYDSPIERIKRRITKMFKFFVAFIS